MATLGTKQVLINDLASWGATGDATFLRIPGFGEFTVADMVNVAAANGAAATKGVFTATITGAPAVASNITFVFGYETTRYASENARFKTTPGREFVYNVRAIAGATAADIAAELRKQLQEDEFGDLPFAVTGAGAEIIFTMEDEFSKVINAHRGFNYEPKVVAVETQSELPGLVACAIAVTTAPAYAVGSGKDLEENEFLDTAATVHPTAELSSDRPIKSALYHEFYFEIPMSYNHEVQGMYDRLKGTASFCIFLLKSQEEVLWETLNAIGAKSPQGWTPIVDPLIP